MNDSGELQPLQGLHANVSLLSQHWKSGPNCNHFSIFFFKQKCCHPAALRGYALVQVVFLCMQRGGLWGYSAPCPCKGDLCTCSGFSLMFWLPPRGALAHHRSQVCVPIPDSQHSLCWGLFLYQSPQQPWTPGIRNPVPHWVYFSMRFLHGPSAMIHTLKRYARKEGKAQVNRHLP